MSNTEQKNIEAPKTIASQRKLEAIVVGTSAGGIKALLSILPHLPTTFRLPIVVVLHLSDKHESKLAEIFQHHCAMPVRQAQDKERIAAGTLYFAAPGYHLSIERDRSFSLSCEEAVHYARPSIDILMQSAADAYGAGLAGVLLTGANQDGAAGLASIQLAGGLTIVQNPATAEISIMPQAALDIFHPDMILSLPEILRLLIDLERTK